MGVCILLSDLYQLEEMGECLPRDAKPSPCLGDCDNCDLDCDLLKLLMDIDDKTVKTIRIWREYIITQLNEGGRGIEE